MERCDDLDASLCLLFRSLKFYFMVTFLCTFQIGGELTDFIIVLHDRKAVKAFSSRIHLSLGAGLSAAAGPIGRAFEADVRASEKGSGICYTYSCSKGKSELSFSFDNNVVKEDPCVSERKQ